MNNIQTNIGKLRETLPLFVFLPLTVYGLFNYSVLFITIGLNGIVLNNILNIYQSQKTGNEIFIFLKIDKLKSPKLFSFISISKMVTMLLLLLAVNFVFIPGFSQLKNQMEIDKLEHQNH